MYAEGKVDRNVSLLEAEAASTIVWELVLFMVYSKLQSNGDGGNGLTFTWLLFVHPDTPLREALTEAAAKTNCTLNRKLGELFTYWSIS